VSTILLPEADHRFEHERFDQERFDHELVRWFTLHGGIWSGTADELLAAVETRIDVNLVVWPQSPRALYAHIESHQQTLSSLGVAVSLPNGYPRMISLRLCHHQKPAEKSSSDISGIDQSLTQESLGHASSSQETPVVQPGSESVCEDTAEALFAMVRTSPALELSPPSALSKLAASPNLLWAAFKRPWWKRRRAM
jgi:hypothetical protein